MINFDIMSKMKSSEFVLFICSVVALMFAFNMLVYLGLARVKLGYWPTYGTQPDPSAFGWLPLHAIGFVGFLVLALSPVVWVSVLVYEYATYGNKLKINKLTVCCFLFGQVFLYVMKYCFTPYFDWYFD